MLLSHLAPHSPRLGRLLDTLVAKAVPYRSLKFHSPGKSGGFGSFVVNATSFVARHHDGDGTVVYTHTSRGPRSK